MSKDALDGKAPKKEKETVEKKVEKTVETKKDYSKLTVAELKAECQKNGIEVKSTMKKADLVEALSK
ncbi:MAG: HeH/LEM domain-containing protein [Clostridium sp.]|nr:HeH/LEM domain-containing protein [Clostridium sp.]